MLKQDFTRLLIFAFLILYIFTQCQEHSNQEVEEPTTLEKSIAEDSLIVMPKKEEGWEGEPIWGYRFRVHGDFNGDGIQDTLTERFIDLDTKKETNKFFENVSDIEYQKYNIEYRQIQPFLEANTDEIDTLFFKGNLGAEWLETIGDIDGNGTDEIGLVSYYADMSSVNTFKIYTLKDQWELYHSFEIRDWALPDLPAFNIQYGLFGRVGSQPIKDEEKNKELEAALKDFKYVNLLKEKTIEYNSFVDDGCDAKYIKVPEMSSSDEFVWIKAKTVKPSNGIERQWIKFELGNHEKETQKEITKALKKGTFEICDPASFFLLNVTFK